MMSGMIKYKKKIIREAVGCFLPLLLHLLPLLHLLLFIIIHSLALLLPLRGQLRTDCPTRWLAHTPLSVRLWIFLMVSWVIYMYRLCTFSLLPFFLLFDFPIFFLSLLLFYSFFDSLHDSRLISLHCFIFVFLFSLCICHHITWSVTSCPPLTLSLTLTPTLTITLYMHTQNIVNNMYVTYLQRMKDLSTAAASCSHYCPSW